LLLTQEQRLEAGRFKALPAVSEWSDFDDCHDENAITCLLVDPPDQ